MTPAELQGLRKEAVQRFLQSALLIDDDIELISAIDDEPKKATRSSGSVLTLEAAVPAASKPAPSVDAGDTSREPLSVKRSISKNSLDAKAITDAFLSHSVICGIFRPAPNDDAAKMSAGAAAHADIIIVDWYLDRGSSQRAKETVRQLLSEDARRRGRLRLIVVYTSNPGRSAMATELLAFLNEDKNTAGLFSIRDAVWLEGPATRIVFINKSGTTGADQEQVAEAALPERLVEEFTRLVDGLLPTFAVSAIAVVRDAALHILALFNRSLDGAFVGHRCALPDPDDADAFAVELLSDELRNVIETNGIAETFLGAKAIGAWIAGQPDRIFGDGVAMLGAELLHATVANGPTAFNKGKQVKYGDATKGAPTPIKILNIARVFYDDDPSVLANNKRLARLSTFRNEALGGAPMPQGWVPFLSIGTVLKRLNPSADQPPFLVCFQPACDSVRLSGDTMFPFQTARIADGKFHLVLKQELLDEGALVIVDGKPRDAVMILFTRDEARKRVFAVKDDGRYIFVDKDENKYQWIGDLKPMKAQSFASQIGARMHSVGVDDLEWLRRSQPED
ncbi:hypothetical protein FJV83_28070 [Mesorhizobium sp. WSM4307]|uniref:response regulator receiver domain n=1 Tax=unclassified Mesorhizobium TaxID=325217 RepID=UPI00115EB4BC|nr:MULTISPECIES: response regulator receiver domain [unclassified Mesorhizobium]TRC77472.1 hypothetical protein FJV81_13135 [Mesorhizobium sp. WSM4315]TRC80113.1 hypothetical protein FJV83_28070 [Mesorhizobium sp. WSM4307]